MTHIVTQPSISQRAARFPGTDSDLRAIRTQLERERRSRVEQLRDLSVSIQTARPTSADDPQRAAAAASLLSIDEALLRIARNRYGLCQECGAAIPLERLQALPTISWCGRCRRVREATNTNSVETRPPSDPPAIRDIVDEWGYGSFPASDPPANW